MIQEAEPGEQLTQREVGGHTLQTQDQPPPPEAQLCPSKHPQNNPENTSDRTASRSLPVRETVYSARSPTTGESVSCTGTVKLISNSCPRVPPTEMRFRFAGSSLLLRSRNVGRTEERGHLNASFFSYAATV